MFCKSYLKARDLASKTRSVHLGYEHTTVMLIGYLESPATGRAKRWSSQYSKLHVCLGVGVSVC